MLSFAYFFASLWLPSYTLSLGFPPFSGALALSLLNLAACGGYLM